MSKCPWARHWTPNCSWRAGQHLAWQPTTISVRMYVWITVSRFEQKLLLNVKYLQETLEINLFSHLGLRTCWTEGICGPFLCKGPILSLTCQILTLCDGSQHTISLCHYLTKWESRLTYWLSHKLDMWSCESLVYRSSLFPNTSSREMFCNFRPPQRVSCIIPNKSAILIKWLLQP